MANHPADPLKTAFHVMVTFCLMITVTAQIDGHASVIIGDTAIIPCHFEGTLRNLFWYRFNEDQNEKGPEILSLYKGVLNVTQNYAGRASLGPDNATLTLEKADVQDDGIYQCRIDVLDGLTQTNKSDLRVFGLVPGALPNITQCGGSGGGLPPCTHHVMANTPTNLTCKMPSLAPRDNVTLRWYHLEGDSLIAINDTSQVEDGGDWTTSIVVRVSEAQEFWCNASFESVDGHERSGTSVLVVPDDTRHGDQGPNPATIIAIVIPIVIVIVILIGILIIKFRSSRQRNYHENTGYRQATYQDTPLPQLGHDSPQRDQAANTSDIPSSASRDTIVSPQGDQAADVLGNKVTPEQILELSTLLPKDGYDNICTALGFEFNYYDAIMKEKQQNMKDAMMVILNKWITQTGGYTDVLDGALITAEAGGIVDKYKQ